MFWGQVSHTETNHKELEGFDVQAIQALPEGHGGMQVPKSDWGGRRWIKTMKICAAPQGLEVEIQTDDQDELQSSGSKASQLVITCHDGLCLHFIDHQPVNIVSTCQKRIKWRASKQSLRLGSFVFWSRCSLVLLLLSKSTPSQCASLNESRKTCQTRDS